MGSTQTLRTGQIVRYTNPEGNAFDAIIQDFDEDRRQVLIKYWPGIVPRFVWVFRATLEIPE